MVDYANSGITISVAGECRSCGGPQFQVGEHFVCGAQTAAYVANTIEADLGLRPNMDDARIMFDALTLDLPEESFVRRFPLLERNGIEIRLYSDVGKGNLRFGYPDTIRGKELECLEAASRFMTDRMRGRPYG